MRSTAAVPLAIALLIGVIAPVHAAPPTVVPSPGYDARLQEQRAASARANVPRAVAKPMRRGKRTFAR